MTLHPPKYISSIEGLGVGTTKTMRRINKTVSIGTEVWNDMQEPWKEGRVIIAETRYTWRTKWEVGKPYIITKFMNKEDQLIGVYCDVARPVQEIEGGFSFVDLYLDVWQIAGKHPVILDEDELKDALDAGYISHVEAEEARRVARQLVDWLKNDPDILKF